MAITNTVIPLRYDHATFPWAIPKSSITDYYIYHAYKVACKAICDPDVTMSIIYNTLSATKAQQIIDNMSSMVEGSDMARQQAYGKDWYWDAGGDQDEQLIKSETTWEEERCVKIKLNKRNTC
jgi:hypothetical protein